MKKIFNKKYFFDGVLIVFSVLFALFINKLAENISKANDREIAIENIRKELQQNAAILEDWKAIHTEVRDRIISLIENKNDTLRNELLKYNYLNLGLLTNGKSLVNANISKTAWETAKSTGIISEFDFETTQNLTEIYMLQDHIMDKTLTKLIDFIFDPDAHDLGKLDSTLIQLQLRFWELTGQEYLLEELYKETFLNLK